MLDAPPWAWMSFLGLVVGATAAGAAAARHLPYAPHVGTRALRFALGVAMAPFLLGLAGILALLVLPGRSHVVHYSSTLAGLLILALVGFRLRPRCPPGPAPASDCTQWYVGPATLIGAFIIVLALNTLVIPLVQTDALEYATAARRLFDVRSLSAYPPLDPVDDPSGFYGPWTHPPLYVTLIYLSYVSQAHADLPGLMRLISPWALVSSSLLLGVLGSAAGRCAGIFSSLFLVSTPLLFFGSDSGAIDSLAASGMLLVLVGLTTFNLTGLRGPACLGAMVGGALWAHSQSVLLIPLSQLALVMSEGVRPLGSLVRKSITTCFVALSVGVWPYAANLRRSGTLVSDNSAVFSLPGLDWDAYFSLTRDLASPLARLQYGILKGWFALESFSLDFWFMTIGFVIVLPTLIGPRASPEGPSNRQKLHGACAALIGWYLTGTVLAALFGIDVMIRNERYLLLISPCVALIAGVAASRLFTGIPVSNIGRCRAKPVARTAIRAGILLFFGLQLAVMATHRARTFHLSFGELGLPLEQKLARLPAYRTAVYLRTQTDPDALVYSLKPSDMYYSARKMVSYLDPRLISIYRQDEPSVAVRSLMSLGVSYVHAPDYSLPAIYNSTLGDVLATPRFARLVYFDHGYQVLRLRELDENDVVECSVTSFSPTSSAWTWERGYSLGGLKDVFEISQAGGALEADGTAPPRRAPWAFQRDYSTRLTSPTLRLDSLGGRGVCSTSREVLVALELRGHGFANVFVESLDEHGSLGEEALGGTALTGERRSVTYARRLWLDDRSTSVRLIVEHRGASRVGVDRATLNRVASP